MTWATDELLELTQTHAQEAVDAWTQGRYPRPRLAIDGTDILAIIARWRIAERALEEERERKLGQLRIAEGVLEEVYQQGFRAARGILP